MTYIELYVPLEVAKEIVCILGNLGNIMFKDMNGELNSFQRGYTKQLRKFDEIEQLVSYMETLCKQHSSTTWRYTHTSLGSSNNLLPQHDYFNYINKIPMCSIDSINGMVEEITEFELRIRQLDESLVDLKQRMNKLIEYRCVISECQKFLRVNPEISGRFLSDNEFEGENFRVSIDGVTDNLSESSFEIGNDEMSIFSDVNDQQIHEHLLDQMYHSFIITGSINRLKVGILSKILWRILHGNLMFHNIPLSPKLFEGKELVDKDCFIILTHGEILLSKIKRVIESLNGIIFPLGNINSVLIDLNEQITDIEQVCTVTEQTLHTELLVIGGQLSMWHTIIKREKYIYATLNLFRQESHALVAEGWVPSKDLDIVCNILKEYGESIGSANMAVLSVISTNRTPPTYHKTNKFTQAFQSIVDAYGIATYKEINPGLSTIVTFPFMFSVMFGDVGHGFIVLLCGIYLIINEGKFMSMKRNEIFDMAFSGRYVIFLMGFFSIYTGLLYNDIFSKSMTLFKSGWKWPDNIEEGQTINAVQIGTYIFGIDFAWHGTENNLIFTNSYKMKLSILMGFIHMSYSYVYSLLNYRFKNSRIDIIGNFIPGLIFMQSIFGYLSWAIIYKWSKDWIKDEKIAPGLLNMLINMFLSPGVVDEKLYKGQSFLQIILLIAAFICVPWLLLYKPLMLKKLNQNAINLGYQSVYDQNVYQSILEAQESAGNEIMVTDYENSDSFSEFNFGDVIIHQVIHTIEFCLNCISHTASYLRLWALSLAHAQLSSVLWSMTIANAFSSRDSGSIFAVVKVVVLFAIWFILTVSILVFMEGTSAMLHSLRLHWVESMSKFFEGEGYTYEPFSFKNIP